MYSHIGVACLLALLRIQSLEGKSVTNEAYCDQELVFAMVVNRHGDRAPDADELSLSDQQEKIKNLTYIEGPEGLTNKGKQVAYQLGKVLRKRYGVQGLGIISNIYFRDEIATRSTDKERTKMVIQLAMAAAYPPEPEQQWDDNLGKIWQPVPYTAVPLSEDYLRFYSNCDKYLALMEEEKRAAISEEFKCYDDLIPLLMEKTGRNFTENPLLFQTFFDLLKSTLSLGLEIPEWTKPLLPRLSEAARMSYLLYFRNDEMKKIAGGVLLNTFIEAADDIISGKPVSQRLRLYSAHDFNVGALMMVSKTKSNNSIPEYGSVFMLELYKSRRGEFSVVPVYIPVAGKSSPKELEIKGCDSRCDFMKFRGLTKEYRLKESDYYKMCNIRTEL